MLAISELIDLSVWILPPLKTSLHCLLFVLFRVPIFNGIREMNRRHSDQSLDISGRHNKVKLDIINLCTFELEGLINNKSLFRNSFRYSYNCFRNLLAAAASDTTFIMHNVQNLEPARCQIKLSLVKLIW